MGICKKDCSICGGIFDLAHKEERLQELEALMAEGTFWEDATKAQKMLDEAAAIRLWLVPYRQIQAQVGDIAALWQEAAALQEAELLAELTLGLQKAEEELSALEIRKMLSGELDNKNCYLTIHSGAGGTEACDWAEMLFRMYQRWANKRGWKTEIVDSVEGDVVGIKSVTLKLEGLFAYGYAKAEKGVHRLVRISPFDSNAKRHTSFASVEVAPEISDEIVVEIRPEDLRVDTYRSSGAGGQHVNKTDSAVRMTHLPTGIVVSCQNQRSQVQNRETCLKMLRSRLYELQVLERESSLKAIQGEKLKNEWGSQIRSYVFQPYTLVNDLRTGYKTSNVQAVMDGELDPFAEAYLKEFGK